MSLEGFCIVNTRSSESIAGTIKILADISINASHSIFEGHFPGLPVVPGVCMMQIIREVLTSEVGFSLTLSEASNVKFLAVLNPGIHNDVTVEIVLSEKESGFSTTSRIFLGEVIFFKMQAVFQATLSKLPNSMA